MIRIICRYSKAANRKESCPIIEPTIQKLIILKETITPFIKISNYVIQDAKLLFRDFKLICCGMRAISKMHNS